MGMAGDRALVDSRALWVGPPAQARRWVPPASRNEVAMLEIPKGYSRHLTRVNRFVQPFGEPEYESISRRPMPRSR